MTNIAESGTIMAEFDESKHPRAEDGKFTNGGAKQYRQNTSYNDIVDCNSDNIQRQKTRNTSLSKKEFAVWYQKIGEIKRGGHVDTMSNGDKLIPIGNKIVVTSGTYEKPKSKIVFEFKNEEKMFENLEKISRKNGK